MDAVVKDKRARVIIIAVAAALAVGAAAWGMVLDSNDPLKPVVDKLNSYGYRFVSGDIFIVGETRDTTIAALLAGTELSEAVEASSAAGFPSDVGARGDIMLMLVELDDAEVITIYLRDERIELCFIQHVTSGEVRPLSKIE